MMMRKKWRLSRTASWKWRTSRLEPQLLRGCRPPNLNVGIRAQREETRAPSQIVNQVLNPFVNRVLSLSESRAQNPSGNRAQNLSENQVLSPFGSRVLSLSENRVQNLSGSRVQSLSQSQALSLFVPQAQSLYTSVLMMMWVLCCPKWIHNCPHLESRKR